MRLYLPSSHTTTPMPAIPCKDQPTGAPPLTHPRESQVHMKRSTPTPSCDSLTYVYLCRTIDLTSSTHPLRSPMHDMIRGVCTEEQIVVFRPGIAWTGHIDMPTGCICRCEMACSACSFFRAYFCNGVEGALLLHQPRSCSPYT